MLLQDTLFFGGNQEIIHKKKIPRNWDRPYRLRLGWNERSRNVGRIVA